MDEVSSVVLLMVVNGSRVGVSSVKGVVLSVLVVVVVVMDVVVVL